ncbi:MAG: VWA domain-containing protein [Myxococcales bacterium]|nr:VWA domain-containing protein [Myxococcales bacterium]
MSFGQPWFLLLLLLPLLVLVLRWRGKREATLLVGDAAAFRDLPAGWRQRLRKLPLLLRILAIAVLAFAVARPMAAKVTERIKSEGIDILLVLDVSESMRALDFKPDDRITVAKRVTAKFIEGRVGDRLGLVLFGTEAVTQCPLTVDHEVLVQLVEQAQSGMLGDSTAIGMALATAVNRLRDAPGKSRVIVLLTDGNNNAGKIDPITAARLAKSLNMKIYTVGVGIRGRSVIPIRDAFGRQRLVPIDDQLDEEALQQIARTGNGKYFRATDAEGLGHIFDEIDRMEKTQVEREKATHYQDRFEPLVWAGVALLFLELLLGGGPLRKVE